MGEQNNKGILLAKLPKGYIAVVDNSTAGSPGSYTRILPNGQIECVTAIPKNQQAST